MIELSALLLFAGALAVSAGSPGPSIAALVARVLSRGPGDVLPFLAAMWVGEVIWLICAVMGLAALAENFQLAFTALKWAGIAYLLYLAWRMWHAPSPQKSDDALPSDGSALHMFATGLAVTLGNPKIMAFYLALLPTLIDMPALTSVGIMQLVGTLLAVLVAVDFGWVFAANKARRLLTSPPAVRAVNRCSAGVMTGAAGWIALRQ